MPKGWYERSAHKTNDKDSLSEAEMIDRGFNLRIVADKKPYFMRYIYPALMSQYNTYIKNTNKKCVREFRKTIEELLKTPESCLSDEEKSFLDYYYKRMPVGLHDCVMNRICMRFENEFDHYFAKNVPECIFDYGIMKSDQEYTSSQYAAIERLYRQYTQRLQEYAQFVKKERIDEDESSAKRWMMVCEFKEGCFKICSNAAQLCDIILDLCYSKNGSKQFAWDMCGEEIIHNLLGKNGGTIHYPVMDDSGDILFAGEKFILKEKVVSE